MFPSKAISLYVAEVKARRKEITEPALGSVFPVVTAGDYSRSECERLIYMELCFDVEVKHVSVRRL